MQKIEKITSDMVWLKGDENIGGKVIENYNKCSLKYVHKTDKSVAIVGHSFNYNEVYHYVVKIDGIDFLIKKMDLESAYELSKD